MKVHRTPYLLQQLFRGFTWRRETTEPVIFLTFDDGPIPDVTDFVLEQLKLYEAKATFFCVGENVQKHPEVAARVLSHGHRLANHTHNHLNGWKTEASHYLQNVAACQQELSKKNLLQAGQKPLFRPPYGRITKQQADALRKDYELVMWQVLSYDFDAGVTPEQCLRNTIRHTEKGSIVLFHDSLKAARNMEYALPAFLDHFASRGFSFSAL